MQTVNDMTPVSALFTSTNLRCTNDTWNMLLSTVTFPLYFCFFSWNAFPSGNCDLEDAINWIAEHEDDPDIDQMPLV